jgi:hypothetical protein
MAGWLKYNRSPCFGLPSWGLALPGVAILAIQRLAFLQIPVKVIQ